MVRIKRKEVRLANRGALKKGFAWAGAGREGVSPSDDAGLSPPGPDAVAAALFFWHLAAKHHGASPGAQPR